MPWFKVDDSLAFHAKTVQAGNVAMGLWVRAGAWCSQQGTEGKVPAHMVGTLGGSKAHAAKLVTAGLWKTTSEGYQFHDWLQYQPSNAEVQADRARRAAEKSAAGRLGGIASGVARRKQTGSTNEAEPKQKASRREANAKQNEAPTRPDPARSGLPSRDRLEVELPDPWANFEDPPSQEELEAAAAALCSTVEQWETADPDELAQLRSKRGAA